MLSAISWRRLPAVGSLCRSGQRVRRREDYPICITILGEIVYAQNTQQKPSLDLVFDNLAVPFFRPLTSQEARLFLDAGQAVKLTHFIASTDGSARGHSLTITCRQLILLIKAKS